MSGPVSFPQKTSVFLQSRGNARQDVTIWALGRLCAVRGPNLLQRWGAESPQSPRSVLSPGPCFSAGGPDGGSCCCFSICSRNRCCSCLCRSFRWYVASLSAAAEVELLHQESNREVSSWVNWWAATHSSQGSTQASQCAGSEVKAGVGGRGGDTWEGAGAGRARGPHSELLSSSPASQRGGLVCKGTSPPVVWGLPEPGSVGSCYIWLVPQTVQSLVSLL